MPRIDYSLPHLRQWRKTNIAKQSTNDITLPPPLLRKLRHVVKTENAARSAIRSEERRFFGLSERLKLKELTMLNLSHVLLGQPALSLRTSCHRPSQLRAVYYVPPVKARRVAMLPRAVYPTTQAAEKPDPLPSYDIRLVIVREKVARDELEYDEHTCCENILMHYLHTSPYLAMSPRKAQ